MRTILKAPGTIGVFRAGRSIHAVPLILLLAALASGCHEDTTLPLSGTEAVEPAEAAARWLRWDECADPPDVDAMLDELVTAVNAERLRNKVPPLKTEPTLMQLADFYACRLVEGDFFSHVDPYDASTVDSRAISFGYPFVKIGENLAAGQKTVREVVADWMASPGHRANILDPAFTEIGVAVKVGGANGPYWVQQLGRPYEQPMATRTTSTTEPARD